MEEEIRQSIIECVKETLDLETMDEQQPLSTIGLDSMNFIRLIVMLEEVFNIEINDEDIELDKFQSIDSIGMLITNTLHASKSSYSEEE